MLSIDNDSVGAPVAVECSTFAAAAIADTAIAVIPAERNRGGCNAVERTENIKKAWREDSITGIVSGDGGSCSYAA